MKIVHFLNSNSFSGAENVVIQIIQSLQSGNQIVYCSPDGPIKDILIEKGIEFAPINKLSISNVKAVVKKYKPDVIHAHDFRASLFVSVAIKKIPIISHLHNNCPWLAKPGFKSISYYLAAKRSSKILCVSPSVIDQYIFGKKFKVKTIVVGNPIDTKSIVKGVTDYTKVYDIVFCGRLTEQKNPIRFINIVSKLAERKKDLKVVMLGDGDQRETVNDSIIKLGLTNNVSLLGFVKSPVSYMAKSKVFVLTSSWEGFGLVAVEALSVGVPVVSTDVGGLPTIVTDECGKLCITDDDFINEVQKLLEDDNYYTKKSDSAFIRSRELDNSETYFNEINNVYKSLVPTK